jgi:pimeloyl-ACP methyl ester carboxylesterase
MHAPETPPRPSPDATHGGPGAGPRRFGARRTAAIIVIGLVAVFLTFSRLQTPERASVPEGATSGQLHMASCRYATAAGDYQADCGNLMVPENRNDPSSRLIALPVVRIKARAKTSDIPIVRLGGGPGVTNMEFEDASRLAQHQDVLLVGYRGADGSSVMDCPEVVSAMRHSDDVLSKHSFESVGASYTQCAHRLEHEGVDLGGYTLLEKVDDVETARKALGYDSVDLLSESFGTRLAMIYSWRHPDSIHRSVMIGANPPGNFLWDGALTDEQIRRYGALCSSDPTCHARTDDLAASADQAAHTSHRWLGMPINQSSVRVGSFFGMFNSRPEGAPISSPMTMDSWTAAEHGDSSGLWFQSMLAGLVFPRAFIWGDFAASGMMDADYGDAYFADRSGKGELLRDPGTQMLWAGGQLTHAWPRNPDDAKYQTVQDSSIETLVIGGNLDLATPPQLATRQLMPHLRKGHHLVLADMGHADDFWTYQPAASTRLISTFFQSGKVDSSLYTKQKVDFTPDVTQTKIAKIILGCLAGSGLFVLVSLGLMFRRVSNRGGFGRKASVSLRSWYAFILGLGGWAGGVISVVALGLPLPLDDALLGVLSVGTSVGLSTYFGWVNPDRTAIRRLGGAAGAIAGAYAGAWYGYTSLSSGTAVLATVVAAIAGANAALIALDLASTPSPRTSAIDLDMPMSAGAER